MTQNNYFHVSYEKELEDTKRIVEQIKKSEWVNPNMIIVNCFPEYSSRLTQLVNHKLSHLNKHELYEVIDLAMPYPNMNQVWSTQEKIYQPFLNYLTEWVRKHISKQTFLFISSGSFGGINLAKIRVAVKTRLEPLDYRFAILYPEKGNIIPDFYAEKIEGNLLFQWENIDNPNRNK